MNKKGYFYSLIVILFISVILGNIILDSRTHTQFEPYVFEQQYNSYLRDVTNNFAHMHGFNLTQNGNIIFIEDLELVDKDLSVFEAFIENYSEVRNLNTTFTYNESFYINTSEFWSNSTHLHILDISSVDNLNLIFRTNQNLLDTDTVESFGTFEVQIAIIDIDGTILNTTANINPSNGTSTFWASGAGENISFSIGNDTLLVKTLNGGTVDYLRLTYDSPYEIIWGETYFQDRHIVVNSSLKS